MTFRLMEINDINKLVEIETEATEFPWSKKNFEDSLKAHNKGWVFLDKNENIEAFALIQKVVDEVHLLNICVRGDSQGKGLGRRVLEHVIDYAKSMASVLIVLEVRGSNKRAQHVYSQAGFNEMSVRKDYYPATVGREDAILMGLDLDLMSLFLSK